MFEDVSFVIPSSGRATKQVTINQLPEEIKSCTWLAVPRHEVDTYLKAGYVVIGVPDNIKGISPTRRYLMETCSTRYLMMLDDDMTFAYRPDMSSPKLVSLDRNDVRLVDMFNYWRGLMKSFAHVGLSARQGNNRVNEPFKRCCRMFNAYMYDLPRIRNARVEVGRTPVMEDFDLTLQLLRKGLPNAVIYKWCWNQSGSNAAGGCSQYRTNEMQEEAAARLAELHPGFVRLVRKQSKNWSGMETRTDVVVSWSKAYASSQSTS